MKIKLTIRLLDITGRLFSPGHKQFAIIFTLVLRPEPPLKYQIALLLS